MEDRLILADRAGGCPSVESATVSADVGQATAPGGVQGKPGVGPVILLLVALGLMIGIGIWLSRGNNFSVGGMTQNTARMEASSVQQTGSAIASAFGMAMFRDSFLPNQITFDTSARTSAAVGIYNPADGFMAQPTQQLSALTAAQLSNNEIIWQRMQATITGVGTGSGYVAVLPGLRTQVCQAVNAAKWGTPPSDPVPVATNVSTGNVTSGLGTSTGVGAVTLDLTLTSPASFTNGRDEGCLTTSDGVNFYFKVISVG
jgi:hypothetical protein